MAWLFDRYPLPDPAKVTADADMVLNPSTISAGGSTPNNNLTKGMRFLKGNQEKDLANGLPWNITQGKESVDAQVLKLSTAINGEVLSMMLHALSQQSSTDLLSAPKVVTKSGQEAVMKVVEEYIYPTEFTVQTLQSQNNNGSSTATGASVEPGGFEMREVGVILQVIPEVSAEGQMINLIMNPQVVGLSSWKDYGYDMPNPNPNASAENELIHLTMEQPVFKVRSISTSISIYNGATVVMGGMITEVRRANNDKIPFLGDIPYLGRLFQNKSERSEKRNLLIFVTARLVDPAGRAVKTSSEPSLSGDKLNKIGAVATP
jgi:general secretion pathway protein D